MKLLQRLFHKSKNIFYKNQSINETKDICSLIISLKEDNSYNFEILWDTEKGEAVADGLSHICMGVTYGFFTDDIISILDDYKDGSKKDTDIITNTLAAIKKRKALIEEVVTKQQTDQKNKPLIRPSEVLKHEA